MDNQDPLDQFHQQPAAKNLQIKEEVYQKLRITCHYALYTLVLFTIVIVLAKISQNRKQNPTINPNGNEIIIPIDENNKIISYTRMEKIFSNLDQPIEELKLIIDQSLGFDLIKNKGSQIQSLNEHTVFNNINDVTNKLKQADEQLFSINDIINNLSQQKHFFADKPTKLKNQYSQLNESIQYTELMARKFRNSSTEISSVSRLLSQYNREIRILKKDIEMKNNDHVESQKQKLKSIKEIELKIKSIDASCTGQKKVNDKHLLETKLAEIQNKINEIIGNQTFVEENLFKQNETIKILQNEIEILEKKIKASNNQKEKIQRDINHTINLINDRQNPAQIAQQIKAKTQGLYDYQVQFYQSFKENQVTDEIFNTEYVFIYINELQNSHKESLNELGSILQQERVNKPDLDQMKEKLQETIEEDNQYQITILQKLQEFRIQTSQFKNLEGKKQFQTSYKQQLILQKESILKELENFKDIINTCEPKNHHQNEINRKREQLKEQVDEFYKYQDLKLQEIRELQNNIQTITNQLRGKNNRVNHLELQRALSVAYSEKREFYFLNETINHSLEILKSDYSKLQKQKNQFCQNINAIN